jgi:hypothetical protein
MKTYLQDFLVATGIALVFIVLGWAEVRGIFLGRTLPSHIRKTIAYGFLFVLGMGYIMMTVSWLDWSPRWIFVLVPCWGVLLASVAWWRYRLRGRH